MKKLDTLMKHHHALSMVVKDLARVKTFYPELYALAVEALKNCRNEIVKVK